MKGFEVCINNDAPVLAVADNLVTIIISAGYSDVEDIYVGGMDSKLYHLAWLNKKIHVGDKIKVRVVEINNASPLCDRYPSDRENIKKNMMN